MTDAPPTDHQIAPIDLLKHKLERAKYRWELFKWITVAVGAVVSFVVIDHGKLRLERARLASETQLKLIEAYSKATEAAEPEIWKRKLDVLRLFATDDHARDWAKRELDYINEFAALDALYRETLKTASQLIEPAMVTDPERMKARRRFEQLYLADLPFAGEPDDVERAMVAFRDVLVAAEKAPTEAQAWTNLNISLLRLSDTLKKATRKSSKTSNPLSPP